MARGPALFVPAALAAAGLWYQQLGTRRDARRVPPHGRHIVVGGSRLHVHVRGAGDPPVVFEAGIGASSLNWRALQERLAPLTRTLAYDRPGYGWSDLAAGRATAAEAAARLRDALRASDIRPPYVLVGHSFGGYIVQIFAARHPEDVAGLVLVDAIAPEDWMHPTAAQRRQLAGGAAFARVGALLAMLGVVRFALARLRGGAPGVGRSILRGFGATATTTVTRIVGEVAKMPPALFPAIQAHWSRPRSFLALARHLASLPESAAQVDRALAASKPWPFPVVAFTAAGRVPGGVVPRAEACARSAAGRHVIVDCGHWVHLDRPEVVEAAIAELVEQVRGRR